MSSMRARSESMRSISARERSGGSCRRRMVSSDSCRLASGVLNWCETSARNCPARSARASRRAGRGRSTPMQAASANRKNAALPGVLAVAALLLGQEHLRDRAAARAARSSVHRQIRQQAGSRARAGTPASSSACAAAVCSS